jgi:stress-induced morphogen
VSFTHSLHSYDGSVDGATHLRDLLADAFPDAQALDVVDRTGGGDHFHVTVVSPRFEGLALLDQHRLVNAALAEPLRDGTIHELRITTRRSQ